jgi:hydroxyacylglutathione hydrolase
MMRIVPVACLSDNYAYLVVAGARALIVDPSEPDPVERALRAEGVELAAILCTHHHLDHVGGNEALAAARPGLPVYAHESDRGRVPAQTHSVREGEPFEVAGFAVRALHVPGHTTGAVSYCIDDAVFTGDTLFVGGCGKLFEGTPEMMFASLAKIAALPDATRVFCGHEYTVSNLKFALHNEPANDAVKKKLAWAQAERDAGRPTVPSTIAEERATNPFVRSADAETLGRVREAKNAFRS